MKPSFSQLKWACRRGMLELDVLLGNFLEEVYPTLSPEDQIIFIRLLDYQDPDLFSWLTGKSNAMDPQLNKMIDQVIYHAKTRHYT